jgi:hypothetical protein
MTPRKRARTANGNSPQTNSEQQNGGSSSGNLTIQQRDPRLNRNLHQQSDCTLHHSRSRSVHRQSDCTLHHSRSRSVHRQKRVARRSFNYASM